MKKTTLFLSILLGFAGAAQSQDTDNSYFMLGLQWRMGTMRNAYADANGVVYKDRFSQLGGDFIVESYDNKYFRGYLKWPLPPVWVKQKKVLERRPCIGISAFWLV